MKRQSNFFQKTGIALLMSFSSTALFAAGIASEQIGGSGISLSPTVGYDTASLRVSSDSADVSKVYQSGESISMDLSSMSDGLYQYELSLVTTAEGSKNNVKGGGTQVGQSG